MYNLYMTGLVLTTKLFIPPVRENAVERLHLIETLLSGVNRSCGLILVSGPAGFGKTSLLAEFVSRVNQPTVWVSLDEGDNDPIRFWTYLIAACQSVLENVGESALAMLQTDQALPEDTIPSILINDLSTQDLSIVVVLDDYHLIQNPTIHTSLLFLLDHLPPNLHMVISTRSDPPWPLARFRARDLLTEIRIRDLRFSYEETAKFLNSTNELNLPVEEIAALEDRTEGWAAGLQLAAIALKSLDSKQGRSEIQAFVKAFTGSHLYVAEYLVEEVLQRQPDDVRAFLLRTSILTRMNAGLCEAVTGCQDGQAILHSLQRANIFLVSLDPVGRWFRYHHLFADLLRARLGQSLPEAAIAGLHRRASIWYERNGFEGDAVNHALAAKDFVRVADLVKQSARTLIFTGRVNVLKGWLDALPKGALDGDQYLKFYQLWVDVLQNRADLSERSIQEKENLLKALPSSPENDRLRGELMAVICRAVALSGRISWGLRLAQEALAYLPPDDLASRARAISALATAYDLVGRAHEAGPAYKEGISLAIAAGDFRLAAHTMMVKGLVQCHYGQLYEAARTFQMIIELGNKLEISPADRTDAVLPENKHATKAFLPAGQGYIGLAMVHLEWNDLHAAENYLNQGMELCRMGGLDGLFIAQMQMSRLRQAKGDLDGAWAAIQLAKQAGQRVDEFNLVTRKIQIELSRDDADSAWHWATPFVELLGRETSAQLPLLFLETLEAIIARVYLAREEIEEALQLLDRLETTAGPDKRVGRLIEVYLLRALAYLKLAKGSLTQEIIEHFEHALALAEPQGYVLLFLEEGPALIQLLNAVTDRQAQSGYTAGPERIKVYAGKLLDAFSEAGKIARDGPSSEAAGLVERLTPREMEVLALIAGGDSNQAIADKLVITVRTVKKHTSNIYGKLNVESRTQAIARAHELGLLSTD